MVAPVRERPPEVARAGRFDPLFARSLGWSFVGHVFVVAAALLFALYAPAPTKFLLVDVQCQPLRQHFPGPQSARPVPGGTAATATTSRAKCG